MMDCLTSDGVIKRLDLAINDRVGVLDIPKLIEKYQRGECISYFRRQKRYDGTDKNGDDIPESTGNILRKGVRIYARFKYAIMGTIPYDNRRSV